MTLAGRVALVTASGRGIGRATALRLAAEGAAVAINDVVADRVDEVVREIALAGGSAVGVTCDVTDRHAVAQMVATVVDRLGPVDVLVNNAGGAPPGAAWSRFEESSLEDLSGFLDLNLGSAIICTRAVINSMVERRWGKVVCISSISAVWGQQAGIGYAAGKAGLHGFVRSLAKEVAPANINVNGVVIGCAPHPSRTAEREDLINQWNHFHRHGRHEEFASAICFLCSGDSSYMSGTMMEVDGGIMRFAQL